MTDIKFKYTVVRENGHVFSKVFDIREIELGKAERWLELNHVGDVTKVLKRLRFTGLTDKNGNEIFEGDKLKDERSHGDYSDDVIEVRFVDGKFCYPNYGTLSDLSDAAEYSEVIGSIYDK